MKTCVICNDNSGQSGRTDELRSNLNSAAQWVDLALEQDLDATLARAVDRGCELVIAAGGDGTVNAVVNALMKIDSARRPSLAIIPLGTANDFACGTLAIPEEISEAVGIALDPHSIVAMDVIHISGKGEDRYYANVAAGGNCVRVSQALTDEIKNRWGAFSYLRGAIDVLADMETYRISVECDGETFNGLDSWAILVANGRTNAGRISVAPAASPADGLMDVVIIRDGGVVDMAEIVANNLLGRFLESKQVIFRQAKVLTIDSSPAMRFTLDGEVVDTLPIRFQIEPASIRVHVSPTSDLKAPVFK